MTVFRKFWNSVNFWKFPRNDHMKLKKYRNKNSFIGVNFYPCLSFLSFWISPVHCFWLKKFAHFHHITFKTTPKLRHKKTSQLISHLHLHQTVDIIICLRIFSLASWHSPALNALFFIECWIYDVSSKKTSFRNKLSGP